MSKTDRLCFGCGVSVPKLHFGSGKAVYRGVSMCVPNTNKTLMSVGKRLVRLYKTRPRGMRVGSPKFAAELERLEMMNSFGRPNSVSAHSVVGVDEVGAGALAGPVISCAVRIPQSPLFEGLNDSKKLTRSRREELRASLLGTSECVVGIGEVSVEDIDLMGIYAARFEAMRKAVSALNAQLPFSPELLLVDGNSLIRDCDVPEDRQVSVVGGDGKCAAIAAASVVAKVTRDKVMEEAGLKWPVYGFGQHAGYGTRVHMNALAEYGPCEYHRRSFRPVRDSLPPSV